MSAAFNLAGLLRLRQLQEDLAAASVSAARGREAVGVARSRRIRHELSHTTIDSEDYLSLSSIAASRASTATLLAELGEVDRLNKAEVERAAERHAAAHRTKKGIEKLEERFEEAASAEELRREQYVLDDLSARAWHAAREVTP